MSAVDFSGAWPLALLGALPLVWWTAWRAREAIGARRTLLAALLRSAALICAVVALLAPVVRVAEQRLSVVYAVDVSSSVSPAAVDGALSWIVQTERDHRPAHSRVLAFAAQPRLLASPQAVREINVSEDGGAGDSEPGTGASETNHGAIDQSATNLEDALAAAAYAFAPGHAKRLVLVSDGNATAGEVWRALPRLQADGVRVFAMPAASAAVRDAWIDEIRVPEDVRRQEPIGVDVRIVSRDAAQARVELSDGARMLATRSLHLAPGANRVLLQTRFEQAGAVELTARVTAQGDQIARNDALARTVWVGPRPRVLYVEHDARSAHYLTDALRTQGIEVAVAGSDALGSAMRRLDDVDVVILSDVPAGSVDAAAAGRLEAFVRDRGGGLIFTAGDNTYGQDGFAKTSLERMLPVRFEAKRKRKDLDLVLLIDRSHSMRGRKLELAKSAALATLDLLQEEHRLAVIAFDSRPHDVVPLAAVGNKRRAEDSIASMTASGQTNLYHALVRAHDLLAGSTASTRHVILLTDGVTAPPPGTALLPSSSEQAQALLRKDRAEVIRRQTGVDVSQPAPEPVAAPGGFPAVIAELAEAKITLSTVAIGDKPNLELLASLARWADGKSYVARSDAEIPSLFVAETRRLLGESIVEEPFRPLVKAASSATAGVDFAAGPPLQGFVVGRAKRFADVLLEARRDQPLLAQTQYGLGRTVVFLSDVKNRWAADWLGWPGYARLWAQVVRDSMPRDAGEGLRWRVTRSGHEASIALAAYDTAGRARSSLAPRVRITQPDGGTSVISLRQVAPGQYRAQVALARAGAAPWRFELLPAGGVDSTEVARVGTRSLHWPWSDEYRMLPANVTLLRALAEQTGGALAPRAEDIFRARGDGGTVERALWPWCVAAALLLYLLDLLVRRAPWAWPLARPRPIVPRP